MSRARRTPIALALAGALLGPGLHAQDRPPTNDPFPTQAAGLLRLEGRWHGPANVVVALGYERLAAGEVLARAGLPGAEHAYVSVTVRY